MPLIKFYCLINFAWMNRTPRRGVRVMRRLLVVGQRPKQTNQPDIAEKWHSIRSISKETNRSTWSAFEILPLFTSPVWQLLKFFPCFPLLFICNLFIAVSVCQLMICHGVRWGKKIVCFFSAFINRIMDWDQTSDWIISFHWRRL